MKRVKGKHGVIAAVTTALLSVLWNAGQGQCCIGGRYGRYQNWPSTNDWEELLLLLTGKYGKGGWGWSNTDSYAYNSIGDYPLGTLKLSSNPPWGSSGSSGGGGGSGYFAPSYSSSSKGLSSSGYGSGGSDHSSLSASKYREALNSYFKSHPSSSLNFGSGGGGGGGGGGSSGGYVGESFVDSPRPGPPYDDDGPGPGPPYPPSSHDNSVGGPSPFGGSPQESGPWAGGSPPGGSNGGPYGGNGPPPPPSDQSSWPLPQGPPPSGPHHDDHGPPPSGPHHDDHRDSGPPPPGPPHRDYGPPPSGPPYRDNGPPPSGPPYRDNGPPPSGPPHRDHRPSPFASGGNTLYDSSSNEHGPPRGNQFQSDYDTFGKKRRRQGRRRVHNINTEQQLQYEHAEHSPPQARPPQRQRHRPPGGRAGLRTRPVGGPKTKPYKFPPYPGPGRGISRKQRRMGPPMSVRRSILDTSFGGYKVDHSRLRYG